MDVACDVLDVLHVRPERMSSGSDTLAMLPEIQRKSFETTELVHDGVRHELKGPVCNIAKESFGIKWVRKCIF